MQTNELNANQKRALTALLASPSLRAAAKRCKLSERTMYNYLQMQEFRSELRARQDAVLLSVTAGLVGLGGSALEALQDVLADSETSPSVKVRAAGVMLSELRHGLELEALADRVSELEKNVGGAK